MARGQVGTLPSCRVRAASNRGGGLPPLLQHRDGKSIGEKVSREKSLRRLAPALRGRFPVIHGRASTVPGEAPCADRFGERLDEFARARAPPTPSQTGRRGVLGLASPQRQLSVIARVLASAVADFRAGSRHAGSLAGEVNKRGFLGGPARPCDHVQRAVRQVFSAGFYPGTWTAGLRDVEPSVPSCRYPGCARWATCGD
jgi:hypothetical protein